MAFQVTHVANWVSKAERRKVKIPEIGRESTRLGSSEVASLPVGEEDCHEYPETVQENKEKKNKTTTTTKRNWIWKPKHQFQYGLERTASWKHIFCSKSQPQVFIPVAPNHSETYLQMVVNALHMVLEPVLIIYDFHVHSPYMAGTKTLGKHDRIRSHGMI